MKKLSELISDLIQVRNDLKQEIHSKREDIKLLGNTGKEYYDELSPLTDALDDYPTLIKELSTDLEVEFKLIGLNGIPQIIKQSIQNGIAMIDGGQQYTRFTNTVLEDALFCPKFSWLTENNFKYTGMKWLQYVPKTTINAANLGSFFFNCTRLVRVEEIIIVGNPTLMNQMYLECRRLKYPGLDFSSLNGVISTSGMFNQCNYLETVDVENFDTSLITNVSSMFASCYRLRELDTSKWDLNNNTNLGRFTYNCNALEALDTSSWNISNKCTSFLETFYQCYLLEELDFSNWDFSSSTTFQGFLQSCVELTTINTNIVVTNNCTNITYMYYHCDKLLGIDTTNWDVSNVVNTAFTFSYLGPGNIINTTALNFRQSGLRFDRMFEGCQSLVTLDVTNWALYGSWINNGTPVYSDFMLFCNSCPNLTTVIGFTDVPAVDPITGETNPNQKNFSHCSSMQSMFDSCENLEILDMHDLTVGATNFKFFVRRCKKIQPTLDFSTWHTNGVVDMLSAFSYCYDSENDTGLEHLILDNWNFGEDVQFYAMCEKSRKLQSVSFNNATCVSIANSDIMFDTCALEHFTTSGLNWAFSNNPKISRSAQAMFRDNKNLLDANLSGINFTYCQSVKNMFYGCTNIEEIVINLTPAQECNMEFMFRECQNLQTMNTTNWDLTYCSNFGGGFEHCGASGLTLNASNWGLDNCTSLASFASDSNIIFTGIENWKLDKCTSMYNAKIYLTSDTDLSAWGTHLKEMTNIVWFVKSDTRINLTLKNWKFEKHCNLDGTFRYILIDTLDIRGWDTTKITNNTINPFNYSNINTIKLDAGFFNTPATNVYIISNLTTENWEEILQILIARSTNQDANKTKRSLVIPRASQNSIINDLSTTYNELISLGKWEIKS